ncbi:hypothetical protein KAI92_04425, partial [Candidatus Parcubacteria bacterium]|nr:hypothetical protein [Candidatus Parcubacteria bacterium]
MVSDKKNTKNISENSEQNNKNGKVTEPVHLIVKEKQKTEYGMIEPLPISQEMRKSYLDYAMSVIVSRALPDARDGLKPVHR